MYQQKRDFVPSSHVNQTAIAPDELFIDLERLLADSDDLPERKTNRADSRLPMNRLPMNQPSVNQFAANQRSEREQLQFGQLPVNATRRLPIFRGLSGSSTDVSPSSCIGERMQPSLKSYAENEYDDYYQSFDDQADVSSLIDVCVLLPVH